MHILYSGVVDAHINLEAVAFIKQRDDDAVVTFMGGDELVFANTSAKKLADDFYELDKQR